LSSILLDIFADQALLGAVLDRIIAIIVVFGVGLVFSRMLLKDVKLSKKL
jgi:hypothetical protein